MNSLVRTVQNVAGSVAAKAHSTTDAVFPPKRRAELYDQTRAFAVQNPKLAVFLALQTLLAGLPILFFVIFSLSVFAVSLVTCVLLAIIAAVAFTLFTTGFALIFVLPTVFVGSCTASVVFFWGLTGYLILQRFNGGETPVKKGTAVGDKLNGLTGGRLHHLADGDDEIAHKKRMAVDSPSHCKAVGGREVHDNHRRAASGGAARVNGSESKEQPPVAHVNGVQSTGDSEFEFAFGQ